MVLQVLDGDPVGIEAGVQASSGGNRKPIDSQPDLFMDNVNEIIDKPTTKWAVSRSKVVQQIEQQFRLLEEVFIHDLDGQDGGSSGSVRRLAILERHLDGRVSEQLHHRAGMRDSSNPGTERMAEGVPDIGLIKTSNLSDLCERCIQLIFVVPVLVK